MKINKDALLKKLSSDTTTTTEGIQLQRNGTVQSPNEDLSTQISTKSKRRHPWCSVTTKEEVTEEKKRKQENDNQSTNKSSKGIKLHRDGAVQSPNEDFSAQISAKSKNHQPWCSTTTKEITEEKKIKEDKDNQSIKKTSLAKQYLLSNSPETYKTDSSDINEKIVREEKKMKKDDEKIVTEEKKIKEDNHNELLLPLSDIHQCKTNIKYTKRKKMNESIYRKKILSIADQEEAYPWEKHAAKNRNKKTPLSDDYQIVENANKLLPPSMKSELCENIDYSDTVNKKITNKMEKLNDHYVCINCQWNPSFSTKRRDTLIKHVKTEIGYYTFRCSFCDVKSNDPRTLITHYATTHGIPSKWLKSD